MAGKVFSAFPPAALILLALVSCRGDQAPPHAEVAQERDPAPKTAEVGRLITVQDQAGRRVELPGKPARVVSLVPAATGILLALGYGEQLVGRTDYDDVERLGHLPSVGGGLHPSLERLLDLEPDLVIRFEGPQDRATPEAMDRAGVPHLAVRPDRIADIREMIRLLGAVTGEMERSDALWTRIERDLARIAERVGDAPPPRVAFLLGGTPPWVAGPGTFLHEILEVAGGKNVMEESDAVLYAPVSIEELVARDVDLLLLLEGTRVPTALQNLPTARVPTHVQSPGVDLANSAREISRVLHPERWR